MSETHQIDGPKIGTVRDAARTLRVPPSYLYERSRHGGLPGMFRVGRLIRFDLDALLRAAQAGGLK